MDATDTSIADVEAGRAVEGVYAVVAKQRRHDRNGDAYLVLELSDPTGRIEARVWRNADWFDRNISEGDRIRAVGKGTKFRDTVQLDLRRIDRVDDRELESFVPAGRRDVAELAGVLDFLISEIEHDELRALTDAVWSGPHRELLLRSPATARGHHAWLGGLAEHTVNVAAMCSAVADRHQRLNRSILLTAALLHDIGRARELSTDGVIEATDEGELVGHVLLTHEWMLEAALACRLTPAKLAWWGPLVHAVSSHHLSAERCRTHEAATLAGCNALDARLGDRARSQ